MEMTHEELVNTLKNAMIGQTLPMVHLLDMVITRLNKYHELGDMIEQGTYTLIPEKSHEILDNCIQFLAENNL